MARGEPRGTGAADPGVGEGLLPIDLPAGRASAALAMKYYTGCCKVNVKESCCMRTKFGTWGGTEN